MTAPANTLSRVAAHTRSLTKVYGQGDARVTALDHVDVDFAKGRFTAVMGPSGSGKSTLMHCVAGLDKPTSGDVFIGDTAISTLRDAKLTAMRRDRIGFVFQAFNLVPTLTARENIELPLAIAGRKPDREWFDQVISTVGLGDRLTHKPSQLSGGQQQRVACARALVSKPDIIFADEPTGNLDSRSSAEVLGFLTRSVTEMGQTIVMVTHDPAAAAFADRALFLADGRIVGDLARPTRESVLEHMTRLSTIDDLADSPTTRLPAVRFDDEPPAPSATRPAVYVRPAQDIEGVVHSPQATTAKIPAVRPAPATEPAPPPRPAPVATPAPAPRSAPVSPGPSTRPAPARPPRPAEPAPDRVPASAKNVTPAPRSDQSPSPVQSPRPVPAHDPVPVVDRAASPAPVRPAVKDARPAGVGRTSASGSVGAVPPVARRTGPVPSPAAGASVPVQPAAPQQSTPQLMPFPLPAPRSEPPAEPARPVQPTQATNGPDEPVLSRPSAPAPPAKTPAPDPATSKKPSPVTAAGESTPASAPKVPLPIQPAKLPPRVSAVKPPPPVKPSPPASPVKPLPPVPPVKAAPPALGPIAPVPLIGAGTRITFSSPRSASTPPATPPASSAEPAPVPAEQMPVPVEPANTPAQQRRAADLARSLVNPPAPSIDQARPASDPPPSPLRPVTQRALDMNAVDVNVLNRPSPGGERPDPPSMSRAAAPDGRRGPDTPAPTPPARSLPEEKPDRYRPTRRA
ncbi:ABC transporter ATP-binding protein [Propionibacterium australiense]|uniref:ABC transporter-like n=1 Tax=Propionibacterium australiense TaxID=119981 RepID=A0A383S7T2_9ACTN|nr:ABC transporter-like [Propionibacterium australiense]VEH88817.1 Lipoprotein-releasing system ATP-binding protein LolD [Propionibacterium australiense]